MVVSMVKQLEDLEQVQGQLQDSILQLQMTQVQQGKVLQHLSGVIAEQQQQQEIAQLQQQQQQQQQQQISLCWLDKEMKHQQKLQQEPWKNSLPMESNSKIAYAPRSVGFLKKRTN